MVNELIWRKTKKEDKQMVPKSKLWQPIMWQNRASVNNKAYKEELEYQKATETPEKIKSGTCPVQYS